MSPVCTARASHCVEAETRVIIAAAQYALRYITHVPAGLGCVNWNVCASCFLTWYRGVGGRILDLPGSVDGGSWPIGMRETTWGYDKLCYSVIDTTDLLTASRLAFFAVTISVDALLAWKRYDIFMKCTISLIFSFLRTEINVHKEVTLKVKIQFNFTRLY